MTANSTFDPSYIPLIYSHLTCTTHNTQYSDSSDPQLIPIALGKDCQKRISVYQPMSPYNRFCGSTLSTAELDINNMAVRYGCSLVSYIV